MSKSKVLFMLSGSIAAFKAAQVISKLAQDGNEVQVLATEGALHFIGKATLEGLSGKPVLTDLWENGRAMDHIQLTRWADFAVLCPASANTLAKLAHGLADDVVSTTALAWPREKAFHIFPAMNTVMFQNPATQDNLALLKKRGFLISDTNAGNLACGEVGEGRLLEPEDILKKLKGEPPPPTAAAKLGRVLITSGATREPIDGIRYLSNVSTGQTGAALASALTDRGWNVTYLHGQGAERAPTAAHSLSFNEYADLERKLRIELDQRDYAAVIHCAAVSDYSVENAKPEVKLPSANPLDIKLKANAKLLPKLKNFSRRQNLKVIGFKLTLNQSENESLERARQLLESGTVDAVVGNDWKQVNADRKQHPGHLVTKQNDVRFQNLGELAGLLHEMLGVAP